MGSQPNRIAFILPLAGNPGLNEIVGEDVVTREERVIPFEGVDRLLE